MDHNVSNSKSQDMTIGIERLTDEDFSARQEKLSRMMREPQMDALLLTAGVDLQYFTDVSWRVTRRPFGAIFSGKKDPIWICAGFELRRAKALIRFGTDVRIWEEHENPYERIAEVMRDLGIAGGNLGIGSTVRSFVIHGIMQTAQGVTLLDGSPVTEACRSVKSEKEIALMDVANRIHKLAFKEGIHQLHAGMTTTELSSIITRAQAKFGAASGRISPVLGQDSSFPHAPAKTKNLEEGDVVIIDGGDSHVEGLMSDATRTVVFGEPTDKQRRIWDIVKKASRAAYEAVRPGVTCEDLDRIARKTIEDAGYGPDYSYFAHRLGHGIGMEMHEYPYLVRGSKVKLKTGMTFTNEPGIYIPGEFGIRIEDSFVVTEDGPRILGGMESKAIDDPFGDK